MTKKLVESASTKPRVINVMRKSIDKNTGREVRQLTDFPEGAGLGYFRMFRNLPDGRMLAWANHGNGGHVVIIDPASGDLELIPHKIGSLKFRECDGRNWYLRRKDPTKVRKKGRRPEGMQVWHVDLPYGEPALDGDIPDDLDLALEEISIDGKNLILRNKHHYQKSYPIPTTRDVASINCYFSRPRNGEMWVYNLETGQRRQILQTYNMCPLHLDSSPVDPTLLRYCHDMPDAHGQRIWTVRLDGSERTKIRPQEFGEMITHEFWWADPHYIGYTYQDRRKDPTLRTHHWAEYAQALTRLGIADLTGREVYLSDPLNCYHSHLYRSPDAKLVSGEGTENFSFVFAATFDMRRTRIDMIPLATIHARYIPFRGQGVDCNFSADGRWLLYQGLANADAAHRQIYAVKVDL